MRGFYWANLARQNLARHLGINSLSKDNAFGSVQPVYQKEVLKNWNAFCYLFDEDSKFGTEIILGRYLHATTTPFQYSHASAKLISTFVHYFK